MIETLLKEAHDEKVEVVDFRFKGRVRGAYCNRVIGLSRDATSTERACILAEELGHYHTSVGNILDQGHLPSLKQEHRARAWGYQRLIPLDKLIKAFQEGARSRHDLAEYLDVTEEFLLAALKHYREKYGLQRQVGDYIVYFEPLMIYRAIE